VIDLEDDFVFELNPTQIDLPQLMNASGFKAEPIEAS
jgi:hypothetical protein